MIPLTPERVEELFRAFSIHRGRMQYADTHDILLIINNYSALKAENDELHGECGIWEDSFEGVTVTLSKAEAENKELMMRIKQLELGYDALKGLTGKWKARAEKAEVELLAAQMTNAKNGAVIVEMMAELAKQAPLIEAVMGAGIMTTKDGAGISFNFFTNEDDKRSILRAVLALREEKK